MEKEKNEKIISAQNERLKNQEHEFHEKLSLQEQNYQKMREDFEERHK